MRKILTTLLFIPVILVSGSLQAKQITIGVSFVDLEYERWNQEYERLRSLAKKNNVTLEVSDANHDIKLQNDQIRLMIDNGVSAIIVISEDNYGIVPSVEYAAEKGVPVIAFDRIIMSPKTSAYVSFDFFEVGRLQAGGILKRCGGGRFILLGWNPNDPAAKRLRAGQMEILRPLIESGQITVVADKWVDNWDPAEAEKVMAQILEETGTDVDAVVASNDGTALGALEAMRRKGLEGRIPISGLDASVQGCNSIMKGGLTFTVLLDYRKIASVAFNAALTRAKGNKPKDTVSAPLSPFSDDNSFGGNIPCIFLKPKEVNSGNMYDEIVITGFREYDQVYSGISPENLPPKTKTMKKK